jgi:GTP-binding protein EngB required for normal cell division
MTTTVDRDGVTVGAAGVLPPVPASDPLSQCLEAALVAADAADRLGLDGQPLRAVHAAGVRRVGFPGDAYVLALVGGTGVGKSSLLNALAGGVVSAASARRPTTSEPIAWIPGAERESLGPLLEWLGVHETREHEPTGLGPVAILDLPDMDSLAVEHRTRVEALLPLVDAVAWVTDPEKYADAVLHDDFLRTWLPRLGRQVVVVNKSDRLAADDARRIQRDLEADLASEAIGGSDVVVLRTSAASPGGIDDLRAWLAAGAEAKKVVRGRIAASLAAAARDLEWVAGGGRASAGKPFLDEASRAQATRSASEAVLRVVDLAGLERQAVAATRAAARSRGAGPLGRLTSFVYRTSGRETAVADPNRFMLRWRERGGMGPAVESIREAISAPIRDAPPALRPALAATLDPAEVRLGLERALDRAIGGIGALEAPRSRWWPVLGILQTLATVGIVLSAAWVVLWILARPVTGSVELPVLGPVPSPFVSLVAFLLAGYVIARLLGAHAGWVGSRWAGRVRDRVARAVEVEVRERAFRQLDELEDARRRLTGAVAEIERTCVEGS